MARLRSGTSLCSEPPSRYLTPPNHKSSGPRVVWLAMSLPTTQFKIAARAVRTHVRCLATPSSSKGRFSQTLEDGPSFDDFVADRVPERVVLGNTTA